MAQPNTDITIEGVAQYLYFLCGKFQLQARNLTGGGSTVLVPPIPTMPNPIEFIVDGTTPIPTGGSSLVIPQFIGYNVYFDRNEQPKTQLVAQGNYYSWNKITGLFQCFPAAQEDEIFSINPA